MLTDHIAWAFLPTASPLGMAAHIVGRITAPLMCFFVAEGFRYTRSRSRYALRLGIFTLLSWPCFSLFQTGTPFTPRFGMLWTLLLGLLALWACSALEQPLVRILAVGGCLVLSLFGDWPLFGVLLVLSFGRNRNDFCGQSICVLGLALLMTAADLSGTWGSPDWRTALMHLGILLALPLLRLYNGSRGGPSSRMGAAAMKYAFYIIYPAHLAVLFLLRAQCCGWIR